MPIVSFIPACKGGGGWSRDSISFSEQGDGERQKVREGRREIEARR